MTTDRLIGCAVKARATMAPPIDRGSENRIVIGCDLRRLPHDLVSRPGLMAWD